MISSFIMSWPDAGARLGEDYTWDENKKKENEETQLPEPFEYRGNPGNFDFDVDIFKESTVPVGTDSEHRKGGPFDFREGELDEFNEEDFSVQGINPEFKGPSAKPSQHTVTVD
ncbi:hypothetical protein KY315_04110 [Candidatus Woesearchaeota archaeon]|nr:hypothetical protein [Candidatus Woesearchaeota archaeon]